MTDENENYYAINYHKGKCEHQLNAFYLHLAMYIKSITVTFNFSSYSPTNDIETESCTLFSGADHNLQGRVLNQIKFLVASGGGGGVLINVSNPKSSIRFPCGFSSNSNGAFTLTLTETIVGRYCIMSLYKLKSTLRVGVGAGQIEHTIKMKLPLRIKL